MPDGQSTASRIPEGMTAIDVHCHVYPDELAQRAIQGINEFYGFDRETLDGTSSGLAQAIEDAPIGRCVIHSVATRPTQVEAINDFIAAKAAEEPRFTGFMAMHQDHEDPEGEIDRAIGLGLRGIKIHPDTQQVDVDDPRLMDVYEIAQDRGIPLIIHCGDVRLDHSHPRRTKRVLEAFPDLVVDAAHLGGWSVFDEAVKHLKDERCLMDMSSSIGLLGVERVSELVRIHGIDRIMFGSDYPMWDPAHELELFASAGWSERELEAMLHDNALRFLGEA